jgi:hypothetical protein
MFKNNGINTYDYRGKGCHNPQPVRVYKRTGKNKKSAGRPPTRRRRRSEDED